MYWQARRLGSPLPIVTVSWEIFSPLHPSFYSSGPIGWSRPQEPRQGNACRRSLLCRRRWSPVPEGLLTRLVVRPGSLERRASQSNLPSPPARECKLDYLGLEFEALWIIRGRPILGTTETRNVALEGLVLAIITPPTWTQIKQKPVRLMSYQRGTNSTGTPCVDGQKVCRRGRPSRDCERQLHGQAKPSHRVS